MKERPVETDPTRPLVLAAIAEYERAGQFDRHADPVDESLALPVTPDFPYIRKGMRQRSLAFFRRIFEVYPFTRRVCGKRGFDVRVTGRENLVGVGAAVITCNHVNKFDCLVVQHACRPNRPFVVGAPFNNMRGHFGDLMRAGGMLPLGEDLATMRAFDAAVRHHLAHGKRILIYPEQAMWWYYEKPRPFKDGAFTIASRNRVPVVPMFITFRPSGRFDGNGIEHKFFTLHIMPPIYPQERASYRENAAFMKAENERMCREKYREIYGHDPVYPAPSGE